MLLRGAAPGSGTSLGQRTSHGCELLIPSNDAMLVNWVSKTRFAPVLFFWNRNLVKQPASFWKLRQFVGILPSYR